MLFNSGGTVKVSRESQRGYCCDRRASVFPQRVIELICGSSRPTAKSPPRLRRMGHRFVRRTQCYQILRVKCAERGRDGRPDPNNAFFHVWAEQCDPKIAANEEFGAAHGGRASRVGRNNISFPQGPLPHSPQRGAHGKSDHFCSSAFTTRVRMRLDGIF